MLYYITISQSVLLFHIHGKIIQRKEDHPDELNADRRLSELGKPGLCRRWTIEAWRNLRDKFPYYKFEAREVDISEGLQHTFLLIKIPNSINLILDGTGVEKHAPFFGFEDEAPHHLQNSRLDMINVIFNPEI